MHIAVDALFRLGAGGGRTHLQYLLGSWRDQLATTGDRISVFTTPDGAAQLGAFADPRITFEVFALPGRSTFARLLWEQAIFPRLLDRLAPDVLLCPGNLIPLVKHLPTVLMLRNMLPFCAGALDTFPARSRLRFQLVGAMMRQSAARADRVVFVSRASRDQLVPRFGLDAARTDVIYHGRRVDELQTAPIAPYPFPYLLSVSSIWPYKNMREMISAFAKLLKALPTCPWRLVIAGGVGDPRYFAELHKLVAQLALTDRVIFTGAVPHTTIRSLYAHADAFIHASTCEAFPQPLLEALSAGVPMACADLDYAREIVGSAALTFDPTNPATIAAQLIHLYDPQVRRTLGEQGRARSLSFPTFADVAIQTRIVLAKAVK